MLDICQQKIRKILKIEYKYIYLIIIKLNTELSMSSNTDKIELKKINNTVVGLFQTAINLLDNKYIFILSIILFEIPSLFITIAIYSKNIKCYLILPIIEKIIHHISFVLQLEYSNQIQKIWTKQVYYYFTTLSYISRKKTIMDDFKSLVDRTGWTLAHILTWDFSRQNSVTNVTQIEWNVYKNQIKEEIMKDF